MASDFFRERFRASTLGAAGVGALLIGVLFGALAWAPDARAQVPERITYQGHLSDQGVAVNDESATLSFRLYSSADGGTPLWSETHTGVAVQDGLFAVELGSNETLAPELFGMPLWLGIEWGAASDDLLPRVPLSSAPYALRARSIDDLAITAGENVEITRIGPSLVISATPQDGDGNGNPPPTAWMLGGNAETDAEVHALGTTDAQPLTLVVNGERALRITAADDGFGRFAPNIIATPDLNTLLPDSYGATVAGGFWHHVASRGTISGGRANRAEGEDATVGGGSVNHATGTSATIAGGQGNQATSFVTTVGGGNSNEATETYATIAGGHDNAAPGWASFVGGGVENRAGNGWTVVSGGERNSTTGAWSAVGGGFENLAGGSYAFVAGGQLNETSAANAFAAGRRAKAGHNGTFVWADSEDADFTSSANNQFLVRSAGGVGINTSDLRETLTVHGAGDNSAIHLGAPAKSGVNGIVFEDDTEGNGVQFVWRTDTDHFALESTSTGTETQGTPIFVWRRQSDRLVVGASLVTSGGFSSDVHPRIDGVLNLGTPQSRWNTLYATNGVINTSDARLKHNVAPLGYGLDEIRQLRPIRFEWTDPADASEHLGLLAQEVRAVLPELVHDSGDGSHLGINYAELFPIIIAAIQQQQEMIEELERRWSLGVDSRSSVVDSLSCADSGD